MVHNKERIKEKNTSNSTLNQYVPNHYITQRKFKSKALAVLALGRAELAWLGLPSLTLVSRCPFLPTDDRLRVQFSDVYSNKGICRQQISLLTREP